MKYDISTENGRLKLEKDRLKNMLGLLKTYEAESPTAYCQLQLRVSKQIDRITELNASIADKGAGDEDLEREAAKLASAAAEMGPADIVAELVKAIHVLPPEFLGPLRVALNSKPRLKLVQ